MQVRVGVDVVHVDEVAASVATYGDRYLSRIYTEREIEDCAGAPASQAASLAARFAAKEATIKALRASADVPPWPSLEVCRRSDGSPEIRLRSDAAAVAERAGVFSLDVSLSHDAGIATAVVVALVEDSIELDSGSTSFGPGSVSADR